jgi:hypothetical protein
MPEAASRMQQHPGEMTAQMRAVRVGPSAPIGRRILRVAIVQEGQVLAEQCFERARSVTIGPAQTDSFVVVDAAIPDSTRIFEISRKARRLHVPSGARVRLAADDGPLPADSGDARSIVLRETSRGRLTLGRTTILFSVEPEPDRTPNVRLPLSVKRGLEIDWTTTIIAAFSFLFHFGVLGSLYSEWQDPLVDDGLTIAKLVETIQDLPTPPPVEDAAEELDASDPETPKVTKEEKKQDDARVKRSPDARRSDSRSPRARDTSLEKAQLRSQLEEMDVLMHSSLTATGPSTDRVIRDSSMPLALLDAAAERDSAVARRPDDLRLSPSDTSSIERGRSLDRLANRDGGEHADSGRARENDGPKADKTAEDPTRQPVSPELPDAQAVIGRLQGSFRRCYQNGLDREDSDMQGSVRITLKVGPNGEVTSATAGAVSGTLSGSVISCMVGRASTAQFKPPKGGGAVLVVPVISRKG